MIAGMPAQSSPPATAGYSAPFTPPSDYTAVIVVAGIKGGLGKTTTAVFLSFALAQAGRNVLLIDADPASQSAYSWAVTYAEMSGQPFPLMVIQHTNPGSMSVMAMQHRLQGGYTDLVIDVGGDSDVHLRAALRAAQKWADDDAHPATHVEVIMPVQPSYFDTSRVRPTWNTVAAIARELGVIMVRRVFINRPGSAKETRTTGAALRDTGYGVMETVIKNLMGYRCMPDIPNSTLGFDAMLRELVEIPPPRNMIAGLDDEEVDGER